MKILRFLWNLFWDGPLYLCRAKENEVIHREHRFMNTPMRLDTTAADDIGSAMDEYNRSISEYTSNVCDYINSAVEKYDDVINNNQPDR